VIAGKREDQEASQRVIELQTTLRLEKQAMRMIVDASRKVKQQKDDLSAQAATDARCIEELQRQVTEYETGVPVSCYANAFLTATIREKKYDHAIVTRLRFRVYCCIAVILSWRVRVVPSLPVTACVGTDELHTTIQRLVKRNEDLEDSLALSSESLAMMCSGTVAPLDALPGSQHTLATSRDQLAEQVAGHPRA